MRSIKSYFAVLTLSALSVLALNISEASAAWNTCKNFIGLKNKNVQSVLPVYNSSGVVQAAESASGPDQVTSSEPKLFWIDCGLDNTCTSASLYYVDPGAASPVKTLFASNIYIPMQYKSQLAVPAGTVNASTYKVTGVKLAYILYFSGGKIWKVDTTTLAKTQVSNENTVTPGNICDLNSFEAWNNTLNSSLQYRMSGPDNQCFSPDDVIKVVNLSMNATTAPITLFQKDVQKLLPDGSYIVNDYSSMPITFKHCNSSLTACSNIVSSSSQGGEYFQIGNLDSTHLVMTVDGNLKSYNYQAKTLVNLYTPAANEQITAFMLDKGGAVFFSTTTIASPYTSKIMKVSKTGGTPVALKTFTTAYPLDLLDVVATPSYVFYFYPNQSFSAVQGYSIPKAGGTAVNLSNIMVLGTVVGDSVIFEDTAGSVTRINLDGTGKLKRANSRINGFSWGGSFDLFYEFEPAAFRGLVSSIGNVLKSYSITDNFTLASSGVSVGTIPVNLNNFFSFDINYDMIGAAGKRGVEMSSGEDILFLRADTASSLKRMTNTNGIKMTFPEPR